MRQTEPGGGDDLQVVRRILGGEQDLFRQIVLRYEVRLIAYLGHMLGELEQARDIAQDTFIAAYQALDQWQAADGSSLSPWLYRIATNRALNALRARKVRGGILSSLSTLTNGPAVERSLEDRVVQHHLLDTALRALSAEDGACLVLHVVAGERYAEIGERLGMSGEAVRKRVTRGLSELRKVYRALDVEARR